MNTVVLSVAVMSREMKKDEECVVNMAIVSVGGKECMVPALFVEGEDLEAKRREAHRLVDECIDAFIASALDDAHAEDSKGVQT